MEHVTVVSCSPNASMAERYAATCAAFAVAEGARAEGQDVLLVLDDFTGLIGFTVDMAKLSPQLENSAPTEEDGVERMVEYEGMIINALLAERRRFLGMTLQRCARLNDKKGGGSLSLIGCMWHQKGAYKGRKGSKKDSGDLAAEAALPSGFDEMSDEMKAKITAALEKKKKAAEAAAAAEAKKDAAMAAVAAANEKFIQPRSLVEEFMSITDGQVMVDSYSPKNGWVISVKDSVSRIGTPGAAAPLKSLDMMQIRLDVMQADDMVAFGNEGDEKDYMGSRSQSIRGVLRQTPGEPSPLSETVVGVYGLQRGHVKNMNADAAAALTKKAVEKARETIPEVMAAIDAAPGTALTAEVEAKLKTLYE
jgi:F-type H+-transporting ATPase subunit alpha